MKFFALAALVATSQAVNLVEPWDPESLPDCPEGKRTKMDDMKTHVTKYPYVGATCKVQVGETALIMMENEDIASDIAPLEHCPDFDYRFTLNNGKTRAVPYPQPGYNCNNNFYAVQVADGIDAAHLEHCPNMNEKTTLLDGKTTAVAFPQRHFNCNPEWN